MRILLTFFLFLLLLPQTAFAHTANQPPFIKINDQYANLYPVGSTSLVNFLLPQDLAPATYTVSVPLHIELDTNNLPILPEFIPQLKVYWDFGDGSTSQGLATDHTYSHPGSFIMQVHSSNPEEGSKLQLLDSVFINVLANKDYKFPQSYIIVNGQHSSNPYTDIIKADFSHPVTFNASKSTAPSSKIVSYFWDFGDGQSSTQENPQHKYDQNFSTTFALLRVKDANGYFSDNLVQLENTNLLAPGSTPISTPANPTSSKSSSRGVQITVGLLSLLIIGLATAFWFKKKSAH